MKTFRLSAMLIGAVTLTLLVPPIGGPPQERREHQLLVAILGAFAGLGVELFYRSGQPSQISFWQFTTRELLMAMAVGSIGLAMIVALWRI